MMMYSRNHAEGSRSEHLGADLRLRTKVILHLQGSRGGILKYVHLSFDTFHKASVR